MTKKKRKRKKRQPPPEPQPLHLSYTGTRWGMDLTQRDLLRGLCLWFLQIGPCTLHHGDCKGGDEQAHDIAHSMRFNGMSIVRHPPTDSSLRAFCPHGEIREPKGYMGRNRDNVLEGRILIAGPWRNVRERRGGTWGTVRIAEELRRPIAILWPKGSVTLRLYDRDHWVEKHKSTPNLNEIGNILLSHAYEETHATDRVSRL